MPRLGEGAAGAAVRWHRRSGDRVERGEAVATAEGEGASLPVAAPAAGVLEVRVPDGGRAEPGAVIGAVLPPPEAPGRERRTVRTVSPGDGHRVEAAVRGHAWTLDEPPEDGGTDAGPAPVEAVLGALLACLTVSFKAVARRRGVPVDRVEGTARANPRGHVRDISVDLHVWSPAPEGEVQALLGPARRGCYVSALLRPDLPHQVTLHVHRPEAAPGRP